jgi:hypothetical protein
MDYPLGSTALRPAWSNRRAQMFAAIPVASAIAAMMLRLPLPLRDVDDVVLRILFPASLAFVLAFAPMPSTQVGRLARDLTVLGLSAAVWAGDRLPLWLACYPLLLVAAVLIGWCSGATARSGQ